MSLDITKYGESYQLATPDGPKSYVVCRVRVQEAVVIRGGWRELWRTHTEQRVHWVKRGMVIPDTFAARLLADNALLHYILMALASDGPMTTDVTICDFGIYQQGINRAEAVVTTGGASE